ncbi:MAG: TonB family protein [Kangiellaceae bacterium]|nr:TonB family protein [Kangiellaceae bacterium]
MRLTISVFIALGITGLLLLFMSQLIAQPDAVEPPKTVEVDPTLTLYPDKKPPQPLPSKPQPPAIEPGVSTSDTRIISSKVESAEFAVIDILPVESIEFEGFVGLSNQSIISQDRAAIPLFRSQPNYPPTAAQNGTEGWVTLKYDVNSSGQLSNISVVDSQPKRVFDREAVKALKKWKFKPAMLNGQPVATSEQKVTIEFSLQQD